MDYREHISRAIDYIEENLCMEELNIAAVASAAGYSPYHFLRVFREVCGLTPSDYIRKRRISEVVRRIHGENRPISDIAFAFGFNSKENFIRAFKAEHHILPTEFKAADNSLKLYDRLNFDLPPFRADGRILSLDPFRLTVYKSDEDYTPNFWNKYNAKKRSYQLSGGQTVADFGVSKWNDASGKLDYFIGIRETDAKGNCAGTVTLDIPGGVYAVFDTPSTTHFNFVNTIHRTWEYIGQVWLPENGYARTGGYEFETYTEASRLFSEQIYIPVKKLETRSPGTWRTDFQSEPATPDPLCQRISNFGKEQDHEKNECKL